MDDALGRANATLAELRGAEAPHPLPTDAPIAPGCWLEIDREESDVEASCEARPGELFTTRVDIRRAPRWMSLTLELGPARLTDYKILGVICESSAPQSMACRLSVRTGLGDGFEDTFFEKYMVSYGTRSQHIGTLQIPDHPALQADTDWRNLMFHFEPNSFELHLHDLRVFLA